MDCSHCGKFKSHHHCQAIVDQGKGSSTYGIVICAICSLSFGNEGGIFCCLRHSSGDGVAIGGESVAVGASSSSTGKQKLNNKATKATRDKEQQMEINKLIDSNDVKIILGMDSSLFSVDMLRKICRKLGFTSRKFNKAVCLETIVKAVIDGKVYDAIDPASSSTATDFRSLRCRLLNVVMSEAFVPRLQFLGARKEISEIDKGGAGQDRAFWEDISIEFNDYSKPDFSKLILSSLSDQKLFSEKQVDPSAKSAKNSS
jgi:hypothetical protein